MYAFLLQRHEDGVVQVTFSEAEEADMCIEYMNQRYLAMRRILAATWDGKTKYEVQESEAEREERLRKWAEFLEAGGDAGSAGKKSETGSAKSSGTGTSESSGTGSTENAGTESAGSSGTGNAGSAGTESTENAGTENAEISGAGSAGATETMDTDSSKETSSSDVNSGDGFSVQNITDDSVSVSSTSESAITSSEVPSDQDGGSEMS